MKKITPIIIFLILFIGMAIFPYIPMSLFNFTIDNLSREWQIIYNLVCDVGFIIIVLLVYKDRITREFKEYFSNFKSNFIQSFKYYLVGFIIMIVSNNIINIFFKMAIASNEETIRNLIHEYPIYMLFSVAIYAPIVEETIFRRSIKDCILTFKDNFFTKYLYIIVSGLIFAVMHILGQTTTYLDYIYFVPYMALGCAFAALYYKTDNLWSTIMLHAFHNTLAIILYLWLGV